MTITEPTTTLTDLVLAAVAGWLVSDLLRCRQSGDRAGLIWIMALAVNGLASGTGAIFHGFIEILSPAIAAGLWLITLQGVGLASVLMVAGPVSVWVGPPWRTWALGFAVMLLAVYAVQVTLEPLFRYAVFIYLPSLLAVGGLAGWQYAKTRSSAPAWLGIGIVLGIAGALIQRTEIVWHVYFSANDLFHLFQLAGTCCFYRAAREIVTRGPVAPTDTARQISPTA